MQYENTKKNFLSNLLLLIGLNLLIKPFWIFGIDRSVQNMVDTHVYGIYFTIFNLTFIFNMLLDMGTTSFNNRSIARDPLFLKKNFSGIFGLRLFLGLFYFAIMMATGLFMGYKSSDFKMLVPLMINQFLSLLILYLRSNISGMLMFKTDGMLSVIDRVIMIICCSIALWGNISDKPFQIEWFIYIQTFSYLITCGLALAIVLRHCKFRRPEFNFLFFKTVLVQSMPFAVLALLTNIHNKSDAVLLRSILPEGIGATQAGIYASAYRLLDAAVIIAYLLSVILLPLFANLISKKENIHDILKTSFILIFIYGGLLSAFSYFYNNEIMDLLYTKHVNESSDVFKLLMPSILPLALTYVFGSLLTAKGKMKQLNIIALCAVIINITGNLILIPHFQAVGSAAISLTTQCFIIIAEILIASKVFELKISASFILKLSCFSICSIITVNYSRFLPFAWEYNILAALACCCALTFIFQLISLKEIKALLKR